MQIIVIPIRKHKNNANKHIQKKSKMIQQKRTKKKFVRKSCTCSNKSSEAKLSVSLQRNTHFPHANKFIFVCIGDPGVPSVYTYIYIYIYLNKIRPLEESGKLLTASIQYNVSFALYFLFQNFLIKYILDLLNYGRQVYHFSIKRKMCAYKFCHTQLSSY